MSTMSRQLIKQKILVVTLVVVLVGIFVVFVYILEKNSIKKETVVIGSTSWLSYTFETAAEQATTIVYGEVAEKGEMQGSRPSEYQTEVTVDVIEWVKGDTKSDQIVFLEVGGETKTKIYTVEGITPVQIGERYVFFLNQYGAFLNPRTLVPVIDEEISINKSLSPETATFTNDITTDVISVHDYLDAIRTVFIGE